MQRLAYHLLYLTFVNVMKIWVVLPAYNEANNLKPLVDSILRFMHRSGYSSITHIVIIDDGSTDNTSEVVKEIKTAHSNIYYIKNSTNLGLGGAMKKGIKNLVNEMELMPQDIVISMDADRTQKPDSIALMIEQHKQGSDIVIASRYVKDSEVTGIPIARRFLSYATRYICHLLWSDLPVKDFTTNYRMYAGHVLINAYNHWKDDIITFTRSFVALELRN